MTKVFISGESINLHPPELDDFEQWASWFNDKEITRFLEQGKFPNTIEMQKEFYRSAVTSGRLLLMIKTKTEKLLGVISLSEINYEKSKCQIAIVCPEKSRASPLAALEAMALVTDHAFQRLGFDRVWAGQAYPGLKGWTTQLEAIGYKTEGFQRNGFKHGMYTSDGVYISITKSDYIELINRRSNQLWPGQKIAHAMILNMKRQSSLSDILYSAIKEAYTEHDKKIAAIEAEVRLQVNN